MQTKLVLYKLYRQTLKGGLKVSETIICKGNKYGNMLNVMLSWRLDVVLHFGNKSPYFRLLYRRVTVPEGFPQNYNDPKKHFMSLIMRKHVAVRSPGS